MTKIDADRGGGGLLPEHQNPTVRRKELGAALRALRTRAGLSIEEVARELMISPSQVSRIETAQRKANQRDVRDMCTLYRADEDAQNRLLELATAVRVAGWWERYEVDRIGDYSTYIGLEDAALSIRDYKTDVVTGLLQTESYTRAISRAATPRRTDAQVDQLIAIRRERQRLLERRDPPAPRLDIVMDEGVLRRHVGGINTTKLQLSHLSEMSKLDRVTLRVVPFAVGAHPALGNSFTVLTLPQREVPDIVYLEGLDRQQYVERAKDVDRYLRVFDALAEYTLSAAESLALLEHISAEMSE